MSNEQMQSISHMDQLWIAFSNGTERTNHFKLLSALFMMYYYYSDVILSAVASSSPWSKKKLNIDPHCKENWTKRMKAVKQQ